MEEREFTPAECALLEKGSLRDQASSELSKATTDAWIGGVGVIAGTITGLTGSLAFILPGAIAAIAFGRSLHHLNKGIELAKEANAPADLSVHDVKYDGTVEEEPALSR